MKFTLGKVPHKPSQMFPPGEAAYRISIRRCSGNLRDQSTRTGMGISVSGQILFKRPVLSICACCSAVPSTKIER